ncbi:MAG: DUF4440 domain-containing protein [Bacteroidota bacterium]
MEILSQSDKSAIDQLIGRFFNVFTCNGQQKPDLSLMYELFIPEGLIIKSTATGLETYNLKQFIEPREKMFSNGTLADFREHELQERTTIFGNIAQRYCLYEKRGSMSGIHFETKGIKTIQMVKTTQGWKISSLAWDDERPGLVVPNDL